MVTVRETTTVALPESAYTVLPVPSSVVRRVSITLNPRPLTTVTLATPYPTETPYVLPEETTLTARKSIKTYKPDSTADSRRKSTTTAALRTTTRAPREPTTLSANAPITKAALSEPATTLAHRQSSTVAAREPSPPSDAFGDGARPDALFCDDPREGSAPSLAGRSAAAAAAGGGLNATCVARPARAAGAGGHRRPAPNMGGPRARPAGAREEGRAAGLAAGTGALAAAAAFLVLLL
jgi:hypothetical protein